jgi:hypothetical protein
MIMGMMGHRDSDREKKAKRRTEKQRIREYERGKETVTTTHSK